MTYTNAPLFTTNPCKLKCPHPLMSPEPKDNTSSGQMWKKEQPETRTFTTTIRGHNISCTLNCAVVCSLLRIRKSLIAAKQWGALVYKTWVYGLCVFNLSKWRRISIFKYCPPTKVVRKWLISSCITWKQVIRISKAQKKSRLLSSVIELQFSPSTSSLAHLWLLLYGWMHF